MMLERVKAIKEGAATQRHVLAEVSDDAKNLGSWQGPPSNIYILIVYSTTSYIYHYFMAPHGNETGLCVIHTDVACCGHSYEGNNRIIMNCCGKESAKSLTDPIRLIGGFSRR